MNRLDTSNMWLMFIFQDRRGCLYHYVHPDVSSAVDWAL